MSENKDNIIDFYETKEKYGGFSNYYSSAIRYGNILYPTSEHFFQCEKFTDNWYKSQIINVNTPNKAKILANQKISGGYKWRTDLNSIIQKSIENGIKIREDWDEIKEDIMYKIVKMKFEQNYKLKELLLSTGDKIIRENSQRDSYWGIGKDGKGLNKLGLILMKVREELRNET